MVLNTKYPVSTMFKWARIWLKGITCG